MNKQLIAKLALIALGTVAGAAHADQTTSSFVVKMTITKTCKVNTASIADIDLGTVAATDVAVSQTGSTTFKVNCSNGTPFYIGLAPSNGNANGAGVMSGTGSNTDKVPYNLYSNSGYSTPWGNTATTTAVGNGMQGTGKGMSNSPTDNTVSFIAYAKATNSDFTPDSYKDTVTVNVNY